MRRKSSQEKKLQGTYQASRERNRLQFVPGHGVASKPPTYVRKIRLALMEWRAVAPFLEAEGILKQPDVSLLASYCILYARWREAALDVETNGQTLTVTSTTRTGKTEKPIVNPAVRNEIVYQSAMMKAAVKFGLNPLDRPRVEAPDADDDTGDDPFQRFLDEGNNDPELDYIFKPSN